MTENIEEILHALSQRRADDYQDWLTVGMALHHAGAPCSVWDEWSKQSPKYKPDDCSKRWAGFGKSAASPVTIATLVQMAKEDGYKPSAGFGWDDDTKLEEKGSRDGFIHPCGGSALAELKAYLQALFKAGDTVNYVVETFEKDGRWLPNGRGINRSFEALMEACEKNTDVSFVLGDWEKKAGAFIRLNPMNGNGCRNSDVVEFRHTLVECDSLPKAEQLKKIRELKLPCAAIVDSGGKSIHAVVKIDAGKDEHLYRERVAELHAFLESQGFPVDKACKNPSRLSRVAGVTRNGVPQALLGVNVGAKSWEEWKDTDESMPIQSSTFDDMMNADANDMSDCVLGNRFLCNQCPWLIVAASGIGKSVLAMQMAVLFASGRELWGLKPHKPRNVLLIQAENNFLDLVEPAQSICRVLELSAEERQLLRENFHIVTDDVHSSSSFVHALDQICGVYHPEIVIIDPLMAYIGGDISKPDVCAKFFRNELNPVVHKHNVALIVLHHTGKPKTKELRKFANDSEVEYLGIGSSDITNWARAISVILPSADDENIFEFKHCKRGKRTGGERTIYMRQGSSSTDIFWYRADKPLKVVTTQKGDGGYRKPSKYAYMMMETKGPMSKNEWLEYIAQQLSSHGEPSDSNSVKKVFNLAKRSLIAFDDKTQFWQGKLYLSDSVCPPEEEAPHA